MDDFDYPQWRWEGVPFLLVAMSGFLVSEVYYILFQVPSLY